MTVGEIFIKLGFHADTFTLKDFSKSLGELPMKAVSSALGIAGVSLEIGSLINKAMDAATGFQMFTAQTGLSSRELQRWQIVAKQVGMSGETVTGSILGINNALGQIRTGHGQAALMSLGQLHVGWRGKNANQILEDIRKQVKTMDPQIAEQWLGGLGISQEMMRLFKMPDKEFNQKAGAVGVMGEGDIETAARLKTAFVLLAETIEHAIVGPMTDLAQVIAEVTPFLREWIPKTYQGLKWLDKPENNPGAMAREFLASDIKGFMNLLSERPWSSPTLSFAVPRTGGDLNLTQYIHSTASPEEVARHAIEQMGRGRTQAAKHFGNTGA